MQILSDLGELPVYCPSDGELLMQAAKIDDGRLLLAVLNMSLDPIDELELCFDRQVSSVKRLRADGEYESVDFIQADGKLTLATSAVVFDPVILIVD